MPGAIAHPSQLVLTRFSLLLRADCRSPGGLLDIDTESRGRRIEVFVALSAANQGYCNRDLGLRFFCWARQ
jgi:hypothetical protein